MRIIMSPAKKMHVDTDSLAHRDMPRFLPQAERLKEALQTLPEGQLKGLWRCSDALAAQNILRLRKMDLYQALTPAILSYEGLAYRYMAPSVFTQAHFAYVQEHLRILSGFYGLLRPFDGVTPYRLEMGAKLAVDGHRDLYGFWGGKLAAQLALETDFVLNLASREYSRAVERHLPLGVRLVTVVFGQLRQGRVIAKAALCKMARGYMVRWLAEKGVTDRRDIRQFAQLGYGYSAAHSTENREVFIKD